MRRLRRGPPHRSRSVAAAPPGRGPAALLLAASALLACSEPPAPGPWTEADGYRWRDVAPFGSEGRLARLEGDDHGIAFLYDVPEEARLSNRILAEGQGVAVGDVDGDGRPDLFFAGFGGESALYRNGGRWHFEDITARSGLALGGALVRGAALVDLVGDPALDLLLTVHGGPNRLFRGDGAGGFVEVEDAMLGGAWASTTPAIADIDLDGDLDLYIANYKTRQVDDLYGPELLGIERLDSDEEGELRIPPELEEIYRDHYDVEFDGRFVRRWERGEPDELYVNDGGRFQAVAVTNRFLARDGAPIADPPRDWGLAARFADWDADGDPDLYVANDFNSPDGIWVNRGDGVFEAAPAEAFRTTSLSSMAIDLGDLDRDGDLDLITTDMLAREPAARLSQMPSFETPPEPPGRASGPLQVNRNAVQLNRGDGTFAEDAYGVGLAGSDWTWGALVVDVDLDGWEDLLVTTGHLWDQLDGDANTRVFEAGALPAREALRLFPTLRQPNAAFRGGPGPTFEDVGGAWGWAGPPDISHGLATGDLDLDGDLDIVVTRYGDPPLLFRNDAGAARVLVRLEGAAGNTRGIGARLRLEGHPAGPQVREVVAGGAYLSSSEPAVGFAAVLDMPMTLTVAWPDGAVSTVDGVTGNREYVVRRAGATAAPPRTPRPTPHFEDRTADLGHVHAESEFVDRARQPLLPVSLDRGGPGVSWFDADADGDPDLAVGAGAGGRVAWMRNGGDRWSAPRPVGPELDLDATAILPVPVRGSVRELLVGSSVYEAGSLPEAIAAPVALRLPVDGGGGARPLAPPPDRPVPSATGPLAQADIDGDGDLDLFVGGHVVPAAYPRPADSGLWRREGASWVYDDEASAVFEGLGLVSGAVFTDSDVDGDPDLALAMDGGPPRLFRNDGGRFVDVTGERGLDGLGGRWNGIAAGDLDADGRPDLVVTGWGTNHEWPVPYAIFSGDLNRDGAYDVIEARPVARGWAPIRRRDDLARPGFGPGLPHLLAVPYRTYATATLTDLVPGFASAARIDIRELRHLALLSRPGGFEPVPLPAEAQRSPAFGVAIGDLDGDGSEDIVLAQNFFAGRPGVPRYDAGRAVWLRGGGDGTFEPVPGDASGIRVYGDARAVALADYDRDGRVDIAFGVNADSTRLYRNRGARPGLRVGLVGSAENPEAIGAVLRVEYDDGSLGPAREVRSGGGYRSRDEATQTMGLRRPAAAVLVVWPGGAQTRVEVPEGAAGITISRAP